MASYILTGDIGGTNARFACLENTADTGWVVHHFAKFKGVDYPSFDEVLESYLAGLKIKPSRMAICAAGPIQDGDVALTNIDWQISTARLQEAYGFEACGLYNDFAGMTRSIPEVSGDDFTIIREGQAHKSAPTLVAGTGTGFGVGYLVPTKHGWHVLASEGGHAAYKPQTPLEFELLLALQKKRDFVSVELVSSGSGLPLVHQAICEIYGVPYKYMKPAKMRELARAEDKISRDICTIHAAAVMGAIGDFALTGGARGGVVLAGGVSERMIEFYKEPAAMARFYNRGPQSSFVKDIPIRLLKSPYAPLIGTAAMLED